MSAPEVFLHRIRDPSLRFGRVAMAALAALALATSCQDSQVPQPTPWTSQDGLFDGAYDPAAGALEFELQSRSGGPASLRLLASNFRYDATSQELAFDVVVYNPGPNPVLGAPNVGLRDFEPQNVAPRNAAHLACI